MSVDELYFHWQRELPRWERIGHPLDTLTVLLCLGWVWFVPPSSTAVSIYLGLAFFSCVFVTKDEWVHHKYCSAGEHWIHALQFVFHTLVLLSVGLLWPALHQQTIAWLHYEGFERALFLSNLGLTFGFGLYQLIYWNFVWRPASTDK
jgi:putative flippase GtrA